MRRFLDRLYLTAGLLAGLQVILIAGIVLLQVGFNFWSSISYVLWGERSSLLVPSYSEFTGFLFAGATFMGLPFAFSAGAHISVELFVGRLSKDSRERIRRWLLLMGTLIAWFAAVSFCRLVDESYRFGDVSTGIVKVPLWIPQVPLAVGATILAIAMTDYLLRSLRAAPLPVGWAVLGVGFLAVVLYLLSSFGLLDTQRALRDITLGWGIGEISLVIGLSMLALLAFGFWIGFALLAGGLIGLLCFSTTTVGGMLAASSWGAVNSWSLAALPIFIWMGEILVRSRISEDLFEGLSPFLGRLPGRLVHVGILGSGIFAAISGSSAATAATIGKVTIPRLQERGYDERLLIGVVAGSGTLGLLIPPSIILIVYGVATDQSIARLFIAGILPGLMLIALFMAYVMAVGLIRPGSTPGQDRRSTLGAKARGLFRLLPVVLIIGSVLAVIYTGYASPTDAAAVGLLLALTFSLLTDWRNGTFQAATYTDALLGAVKTSGMIGFIFLGANLLTVAMGFTGIPREIAEAIGGLGLSPGYLIFALTLFFVVLGCFLDGVSIVLLTTAVLLPLVQQAGIDLIWFGIYLVLVVEMSQITPPVGFNLFVLQSLTGRDLLYVARCALPFFALMCFAVFLIFFFPEIATYLPEKMNERL